MSTPRKHHFVPRFYLGGFTPSGSKDDKLFVFDIKTRKQWQSSPANVACERDFYILEVDDDGDPFMLEKAFSEIEDGGAEALRYLQEHRRVPDGELFSKLMTFVALMGTRVPGSIAAITKPFEQIGRFMLAEVTATKQRWEATIARMKAAGQTVEDIAWEKMRDFAQSDRCQVKMSQNFKMSTVLEKLDILQPLLEKRKWSLATAPDGGPFFICSDRPLGLNWADGVDRGILGPGFGMLDTLATFPISKDTALFGMFEVQIDPHELDARGVASLNASTASAAERFIYSETQDFVSKLHDGTVGGIDDVKRRLASQELDERDDGADVR